MLKALQDSLSVLSPELIPIHERLVSIRRQLVALAAKETATQAAIKAAYDAGHPEQANPPDGDGDGESKTPTKDQPNPEPVIAPKLKAELKPLVEELRKIDSLSVPSDAACKTVVNASSDVLVLAHGHCPRVCACSRLAPRCCFSALRSVGNVSMASLWAQGVRSRRRRRYVRRC